MRPGVMVGWVKVAMFGGLVRCRQKVLYRRCLVFAPDCVIAMFYEADML